GPRVCGTGRRQGARVRYAPPPSHSHLPRRRRRRDPRYPARAIARRRTGAVSPDEAAAEVRRIEITTRHLVRDIVAREYSAAFRGRGVEFAEVREYQPGDDVRSIDWNVTARLGTAYVKRFLEERELTVLFVVDYSASGAFGTGRRTKRELAVEVCAV